MCISRYVQICLHRYAGMHEACMFKCAVTCASVHGFQETILEVILQELLILVLETESLVDGTCK